MAFENAIFSSWQAMQTRNSLLVLLRTATALQSGKQGLPIQVLQIGKQCPDGCLQLCKQCTDPDLRQFLHRLVGNTSQTQKSHSV